MTVKVTRRQQLLVNNRLGIRFVRVTCLMQGVHESKGVTGDYLRLEALIQKVVSPYLGTHGLYSRDGSSSLHCSSCVLGMSEVMFDECRFRCASRFCVFFFFLLLLTALNAKPSNIFPRKASAALLDLQVRQLPGGQEPSGTLQELQRSHADPRGGV